MPTVHSDPHWRYGKVTRLIRRHAIEHLPGGILTALALYCLEQEKMKFVLHSAASDDVPWENRTVQSRTRDELISRSGSRYAPSSPCEGLDAIEQSDGPCVFIGKPCDTAAVSMLRRERPALDQNLGLVLTFFCAGTPSTGGTLEVAKSLNIQPEQINSVRYRGEGWPGNFKIVYDDGRQQQSLSYAESWGQLTHHRSLRCNLCPDGLGRLADISCGDAWENDSANGNPGLSIVIVRTATRQENPRWCNRCKLCIASSGWRPRVFAAQLILRRRTEIFGRLLALRIFGIPVPSLGLFSNS